MGSVEMAGAADPARHRALQAAAGRFVRATYGPGGTLRLHRAALGLDLLRAPLNVALAPVDLLLRLARLVLNLLGFRRAAAGLARRNILLTTEVSRCVGREVYDFLRDLEERGLRPPAPAEALERAVADYTSVRNAIAEITTSLIVLTVGIAMFRSATPGVVSLAAPVADLIAQAAAIADFPLGERAGRIWYGLFPARLTPAEVVATGVVLALAAAAITTFAGLLADPVQVATGTHRRRLLRLIQQLDRQAGDGPVLAREHLAARLGDLSDLALGLWRSLRG